jgi:hypothetical protein
VSLNRHAPLSVSAERSTAGACVPIDVPAGVLPTLAFKPTVHLNYEETVLPMKDGLPKLRDFPPASAAPARQWRNNAELSKVI